MTIRVARTLAGVLLALLLGALVAPIAALHPGTGRHTAATTQQK